MDNLEDIIVLSDSESEYDSDDTLPPSTENLFNMQSTRYGLTLHPPLISVDSCNTRGIRLKVGDSVELGNQHGRFFRGDFMRIKRMIKNVQTDEITLEGYRLRRNTQMLGRLPPKLNELCLVMESQDNDPRPRSIQGLERIPIASILKKRLIIFTNMDFPTLSFRAHTPLDSNKPNYLSAQKSVRDSFELVCRWVFEPVYKNRAQQAVRKSYEATLRRMAESESDPECSTKDDVLLAQWRGYLPAPLAPGQSRSYKYADGFCGCGGVSSGASAAGLDVIMAFDSNREACETFRLNNPTTDVYHATADNVIVLLDSQVGDVLVDALHLSPPCQAWAHCNTRGGSMDEVNEASLFAIAELLRKMKPRVVTVEETSGLAIITKHSQFFNGLLALFTMYGYSIRWSIKNFAEFGNPQPRKRLWIYASCPGGVLPEFPAATHGYGLGLQPFVTIAHALGGITAESTDNDPHGVTQRDEPPYSQHTLKRRCITCDGGTDYHFSGTRNFTVRELACLQGFPSDFKFVAHQRNAVKTRQIGNAVPPVVAKTMLMAVRTALEREDRAREQNN